MAPRFLFPVAMDQPTRGAEPNIVATPDGALFIAAPAGCYERPNALEGFAWLWRSTDAGATWETLKAPPPDETPLPDTSCTGDADVVASGDGWVYYTDWWRAPARSCVPNLPVPGVSFAPCVGNIASNFLVARSSDGGTTWDEVSITVPSALVNAVDRQWLVAGEDGLVGLFYVDFGVVNRLPVSVVDVGVAPLDSGAAIQASFSLDHGASWGPPVTVAPSKRGDCYQITHPFTTPAGSLVMPYGYVACTGDFWTDPSEVRVAVSEDGGATWREHRVAEVPGGFDNIWAVQGAADAAGNLYVAWAARAGKNMTVSASRSSDGGASWSPPTTVRTEGLNFMPWVAARGDGQVAVAWYGGNHTGSSQKADEDDPWFAYVAESLDHGASFAITKTDERPVKLGPLCPLGAACGSDRELLDYLSLAYAPDGRLHVAFARSRAMEGGDEVGHVHYAGEA